MRIRMTAKACKLCFDENTFFWDWLAVLLLVQWKIIVTRTFGP